MVYNYFILMMQRYKENLIYASFSSIFFVELLIFNISVTNCINLNGDFRNENHIVNRK